jgi:hypothetical protein
MARKNSTTLTTSSNALDTAIAAAKGEQVATLPNTPLKIVSDPKLAPLTKKTDAPASTKTVAKDEIGKAKDAPVETDEARTERLRLRGIKATISRKLGKGLTDDVTEIMAQAIEDSDDIRIQGVAEMIDRMGDGTEKRAKMAEAGIVPSIPNATVSSRLADKEAKAAEKLAA